MSIFDQTASTKITKQYLIDNDWNVETNWTGWISAIKSIPLYSTRKNGLWNQTGYLRLEYHIKSPYSKHVFIECQKRNLVFRMSDIYQEQIDDTYKDLDGKIGAYEVDSVEDLEQTITLTAQLLEQDYNITTTKPESTL